MNIFITGATGYIGQRLTEKLLLSNDTLHLLCRKKPEQKFYQHPCIKIFIGDFQDKEAVQLAMTNCEQVYHVGAFARVWAKDPETYFTVNVQGTLNLLDSAIATGVKKFLFTSTGGTLGVSNRNTITEDSIRTQDFFNEYESSKFMAEEKVIQFALRGLHACIVHPIRVYGPGIWTRSNAVSFMIKSYIEGHWHTIPGDGQALGSFSFIDDVVDGHLLAMKHGRSGERYILGGPNASFLDFFTVLKLISGKRQRLFKFPVPLLMLFGWKEEVIAKLFGSEPVITRKWINKYRYNSAFSSDKALREIGYKITPLEEGLSRTLHWLKESKKK
jgi:nucleoside-diphosphate-sugar epimerase